MQKKCVDHCNTVQIQKQRQRSSRLFGGQNLYSIQCRTSYFALVDLEEWIRNLCLDPDPELGKFKAGSEINHSGSATLIVFQAFHWPIYNALLWISPDLLKIFQNFAHRILQAASCFTLLHSHHFYFILTEKSMA